MREMDRPFITLYTPTFRRPRQLAACLESVGRQTAVDAIEQLVIPDHVGLGIGGMYRRVPQYLDAVHGEYVHLLADDDVLASPTVVEQVREFARDHQFPPVILVNAVKSGLVWPCGNPWPPRLGMIDLGCFIVRADVWKAHAGDYGDCYEGDYFFGKALCEAGHRAAYFDLIFSIGAVSRGVAEPAA